MLNNHDIISLIENRLDSVSAEYQSVDNKIEIYGLDGAVSYTHLTLPTKRIV